MEKFSSNIGHNILNLYNALVETIFTTSKTKRSIYNHFHIILRFLMSYQIFLLPQVKRCAIIT